MESDRRTVKPDDPVRRKIRWKDDLRLSGDSRMLRTIFSIGLFAVLGLIALKFIFGILGFAVGLFMMLLVLAVKIAIVLLIIYVIIRIVSPETARRMRERWSGPAA